MWARVCANCKEKKPPIKILECSICRKLYKGNWQHKTSKPLGADLKGPLYCAIYNVPHLCTFTRLKEVHRLYKAKSLSSELYNEWMEINGGLYQVSDSAYARSLYDDRLTALNDWTKMTAKQWKEKNAEAAKIAETKKDRRFKVYYCKHGMAHLRTLYFDRNKDNPESYLWLEDVFPPTSKVDAAKNNLPLHVLWWSNARDMRSCPNWSMDILKWFPLGSFSSMISMFLIWSGTVPWEYKLYNLMEKDEICCATPYQISGYLKAIGVAMRRCGSWINGDKLQLEHIATCSYLEMFLGRSGSISDWDLEKSNRTGPPIYLRPPHSTSEPTEETNNEVLKDMRIILESIMSDIIPIATNDISWEEYCKRRQSWISGGSTGGEKFQIKGKEKIRLDKHSYFESIKTEDMVKWLDDEPILSATGSEKLEQSKARAIYGTKAKDYAITSYALMDIENRMSLTEGLEENLSEDQEIAALCKRAHLTTDPEREMQMFDYSDFNLQHTLVIQSLVFEVMAEIMERRGYHPDRIRAARWAAKAFLNSWVKFPQDKEAVRITQGLFSGCRSTHYSNTTLNLSYYRYGELMVFRLFNLTPNDLYHVHKGDDVWVSHDSRLYAIALFKVLNAINFKFSQSKQKFGSGTGEYLRVLYHEGKVMGYQARSTSTMLERPIQSQEIQSPTDKLPALFSQVYILARRGLSPRYCEIVIDALVQYWSCFAHKDLRHIRIPRNIIIKDARLGGLGLNKPGFATVGGVATKFIPRLKLPDPVTSDVIPNHMSKDWVDVISQTVKCDFDSKVVGQKLHAENVMDTLTMEERIHAIKKHAHEVRTWRGRLPREEVSETEEAWMNDLKTGSLDNDLDNILQRIYTYKDPKIRYYLGGAMDSIRTAIHGSPFRDIATAQRAKKLSVIKAARVCIDSSYSESNRQLAAEYLSILNANIHENVLAHLLTNIHGMPIKYEAIYHPIILSLLNRVAVNKAIMESINLRIKNINQWEDILCKHQHNAIYTAGFHPWLRDISRY